MLRTWSCISSGFDYTKEWEEDIPCGEVTGRCDHIWHVWEASGGLVPTLWVNGEGSVWVQVGHEAAEMGLTSRMCSF